jgi:hypothetical protein
MTMKNKDSLVWRVENVVRQNQIANTEASLAANWNDLA